jgi:ligand-binding sensor domain-containing protein
MKKIYFFLFFIAFTASGQQNNSWKGYFSYTEIKDLSQSPTSFYAASENAVFIKNLSTGNIQTINTIDGLSGQTITAMYHSPTQNKTVLGYENGLITIINDADQSIRYLVDIINKQLPPNVKRVNHFAEHNQTLYVSCDFGIVALNLATMLFGDTFFIGNNGAELSVQQTAVFDNKLFAATTDGIRQANLNNPNLIDFSQWTTLNTGSWTKIQSFNAELLAANTAGQLFRFNSSIFNFFTQLSATVSDMRAAGNQLVVTTANAVMVYNQALNLAVQVPSSQISSNTISLSKSTVIDGVLYIGTLQEGVYTKELTSSILNNITPDGPLRNNIWSLNLIDQNLYATFGSYSIDFVPAENRYGLSKFDGNAWLNIPYNNLYNQGLTSRNLVRLVANPNNPSQIYIASFHDGLLKLEDDQLAEQYNQNNSGLESLLFAPDPTYKSIRIELGAFDRNGALWMTNGQIDNGLKVLRPNGSWQSYNTDNILSGAARFGRMIIDKNGTKWVTTYSDGVVAFNENGNTFKKLTTGPDQGNLPSALTWSLAVDNNNQLWIGTYRGLRVLPSVDRFQQTSQMTSNPIIIVEDEVAQELLFEQFITDIVVDGANNKWIGTGDSGVFLVSPNGRETIYRFNTSNSPLPSNEINDIEINGQTGEVYIATSKGMVSFKGTATNAEDNLSRVFVYPNPVRPEFSGTVKVSGLTDQANVKIADIEGNLVYEQIAEGGTIEWDTRAFGKYLVASGVYMIFISTEDGAETAVKKVMIIR